MIDTPSSPQSCCSTDEQSASTESLFVLYKPLLVIIGMLLLTTVALAWNDIGAGQPDWGDMMQNFMAGFFLVFSGLKLLDLAGFAQGYGMYDLLASRVPAYGYVYPFLELALGLAYLTGFLPFHTNIATFVLMTFSAAGVANSLRKKEDFQCACLGTFLKVPLTKVALIEDLVMGAMAGVMVSAYLSASYFVS